MEDVHRAAPCTNENYNHLTPQEEMAIAEMAIAIAPASSVTARLLDVVQVDHPENPWADPPKLLEALNVAKQASNPREEKRIQTILAGKLAVRLRNRLIVDLLSQFGMRRGELLELKVSNLQGESLFIHRQPDVSEDPRKYAPLRMTRGRKLLAYPDLQAQWFDYARIRGKLPGALKHPFLLVNHRDGSPLSSPAVTRIFSELRKVVGLPSNLTPHHLRRFWNEEFSRLADEQGWDPARKAQIRAYQIGSCRHEL